MAARIVLFVCAQVLLVQSISAQCAGRWNSYGNALAADRFAADIYSTERYTAERLGAPFAAPFTGPLGAPLAGPIAGPLSAPAYGFEYGAMPFGAAASYGGALGVASSSPLPPSGVSILSENAIEGPLAVSGQLPFLGTVALEGALPTVGAGAVNYGCGNGNVAMLSEGPSFGPAYGAFEPAYGAFEPAYGAAFEYGAYAPAAYGYGAFGRC